MKDYSKIIGKITSTPWLIEEGALKMILEIFEAHLNGSISQDDIRIRVEQARQERGEARHSSRNGSVGVLALHGPIFPRANLMTDLSGATDLSQWAQEFRAMVADESVAGILLDIDSPGGLSDMVDEMATEIREARDKKPIHAIANAAANSAAYYLASQATKMFSTPSGQVGSIGTYLVHTDDSKLQDMKGQKQTIIKAGRFKAVMAEPLTGEARQYLEDFVNDTNDGFISAVALGRRTTEDDVRANYGEGGVVSPKRALSAGMIDGIAPFDEVLANFTSELSGGGIGLQQGSSATAAAMSANPVQVGITTPQRDVSKEHSEPGTGQGGEPTPKESPRKDDPAIQKGWRRDSPPAAYETEEFTVNRAWLEARATALGVEFSDETSDDDLATAVAARVDEVVVPLTSATAEAERQRDFARDYPEQAAEYERLMSESRENAAINFAEGYTRFEGQTSGFSTIVRDKIKDCHLKLANRQFQTSDLQELLDLVAKKEAKVDWSESGSSRQPESVGAPADFTDARKQFADLVRSAMTEDGLSRQAAIEHVSKQNPELARQYAIGHVKGGR